MLNVLVMVPVLMLILNIQEVLIRHHHTLDVEELIHVNGQQCLDLIVLDIIVHK